MPPPSPAIEILYNGVNISHEIGNNLIALTYSDKSEDESDEVEIELEDIDARWRNEWYPGKKDSISVKMGYLNKLTNCGTFMIDEIEATGPPDVVKIRAVAAILAKNLRTKRSSAHESKTLFQIAKYVADKNGFTIIGNIPNVSIKRCSQHRETDLHWLRRLSIEYGVVFSLRNKQLIFTSIYDLEGAKSILQINRNEMKEYSFTDKLSNTYSSSQVSYHDPTTKKIVDTTYHTEKKINADGIPYEILVKDDVLKVYSKTETDTQALAKAKAALYRANTKEKTAEVTVEGNPLMVSGVNVDVVNMGVYSGKYNILKSVHTISKYAGYVTKISAKAVGTTKQALNKQKRQTIPAKPRTKDAGKNTHGQCAVLTNKNVSFSNSINAGN